MLGICKYNPPKDPEKKADADACMAMYDSLSDMYEDRKRFLLEFEANNQVGCKSKDGLKFALNFAKSVSTRERIELGDTADYFTRTSP